MKKKEPMDCWDVAIYIVILVHGLFGIGTLSIITIWIVHYFIKLMY